MFPHRIDGKLDLICPFAGFRFSNMEEFKNCIKTYFNKDTGYPGLYFELPKGRFPNGKLYGDREVKLCFSGHQYEFERELGRWTLLYPGDKFPHRWQHLTEELLALFKDAAKVDEKMEILNSICKQNNGLTIQIKS